MISFKSRGEVNLFLQIPVTIFFPDDNYKVAGYYIQVFNINTANV